MSAPLSVGMACFPSLGGSGVVASDLAVGLATRGHRIHVIAASRPGRLPSGCDRLAFHAVDAPGYPVLPHPPYTVAMATRLVDVVRAHALDVVHVHYAVPHAASALLARTVLGRDAPPLVMTLHGTDVTRLGRLEAYRSVTAFAVADADAVTVPSAFLRDAAREGFGIPDAKEVHVIPNFVDEAHFAPPAQRDRTRFAGLFERHDDGPVVVHVSNFRAVKRPLDLVEVLARVRRDVPARLLLIGEGPERAAVEERATALGLAGSTCFLGKRHEFVEYLRHADAFLLTSECESFGVAALEALSAGVPVFAYRVGGLPELVAPGSGLLVEPFDVDALARAVVDLLGDPGRREAMGLAARAHALSRFGREPALVAYESLYQRLLSREVAPT